MSTQEQTEVISADLYRENRDLLWSLSYRMTGNAADADEIVQETFTRALEKPPRRIDEPLRPWLVRVALNLSRDILRRRRRSYVGPWLPSPLPTGNAEEPHSYEPAETEDKSPAARYEMIETVSFAFLLALEALTPMQRAVLLLRDAFDYSTAEAAEALGTTEASVKVTLHRARKAMKEYDKSRKPLKEVRRKISRALEEFLRCLQSGDVKGLEQLFSLDILEISDGGGEVPAARFPIQGRDRVLKLLIGLGRKYEGTPRVTPLELNGLPALLFELPDPPKGLASIFTMHCDVDDQGRITWMGHVVAPQKLSAVPAI